jgi:pimeloyl-ACP methyl ester carboxylesterase
MRIMPRTAIGVFALISWSLAALLQVSSQSQPVVSIIEERPAACDSPCNRTAVIFVHGIGGSVDTWTDDVTKKSWPNLLASDDEIGNKIDIYQIDYNSSLLWKEPTIVETINKVDLELDRLFYKRQYKKITMICHSMGGIICRAYLLHVKAKYGHRILSKFRLMFAMGVPTKGSDYANFMLLFSASPELRVLTPISQNDFGQLLNLTLTDLLQKHRDQKCPTLSIYAGFEKNPLKSYKNIPLTGLNIKIVDEPSATYGADISQGFDKDHFTLVKPTGATDFVHTWVRNNLAACILGNSVCVGDLASEAFKGCGRSQDEFPTPDVTDTLFNN